MTRAVIVAAGCLVYFITLTFAQNHFSGTCISPAQLTQELWDDDIDRLSGQDLVVAYQNQIPDGTRDDHSQNRFFASVNEAKLQSSQVYQTFLALLDNYDPRARIAEHVTAQETSEEKAFLDAVLQTGIFAKLTDYLICRGKVSNSDELRVKLNKMWFQLYPRSGTSTIPDSSGFEHVFVGEYKRESVNGFHSWLTFYEREKAGKLNYFGFISRQQGIAVGAAFAWNGHVKTEGSFFLGTSPAFDLAVYSLNFLDRSPGVTIDGHHMQIKTYNQSGHVASSYVDIPTHGASPSSSSSSSATADRKCEGRCGASYDRSKPCQCNNQCVQFGNCCDDYQQFCAIAQTVDDIKAGGSCTGRCGAHFDGSFPCQCNSQCQRHGDCCEDYNPTCAPGGTCEGRCGAHFDSSNPCQCNSSCQRKGDCCEDYHHICVPGTTGGTEKKDCDGASSIHPFNKAILLITFISFRTLW